MNQDNRSNPDQTNIGSGQGKDGGQDFERQQDQQREGSIDRQQNQQRRDQDQIDPGQNPDRDQDQIDRDTSVQGDDQQR